MTPSGPLSDLGDDLYEEPEEEDAMEQDRVRETACVTGSDGLCAVHTGGWMDTCSVESRRLLDEHARLRRASELVVQCLHGSMECDILGTDGEEAVRGLAAALAPRPA